MPIRKLTLAGMLLGVTGCSLFNQHAQMMDAMRGPIAQATASLREGGHTQVSAGGQVINPKIRVAAGIIYFAEAGYDGVAGQVQGSLSGTTRDLTPTEAMMIERITRNSTLTDAERAAMLRDMFKHVVAPASQPSP